MAHLATSAIFSPSVARQQQAAAKDWNYVDHWLSQKYHNKTPPPFERNNDTLKALLALASINEAADEERNLLCKVELKVLGDLQAKEEAELNAGLLDSIEAALTREGKAGLDALASVSVALNQHAPDIQTLGEAVVDLQIKSNDLDQASDRVAILETQLKNELEQINKMIEELQSDNYQPQQDVAKQTTEYQRKTKALASKLPGLRDRINSLSAGFGKEKITILDVNREENIYKELMNEVKDLEAQVKGYHGLPQDTDLARLELEGVRVELRGLTRDRDSMFEGLVERESPIRKPRR